MRKIKSAFIGRNKEMGFTNSERVTHTKKIIQLNKFYLQRDRINLTSSLKIIEKYCNVFILLNIFHNKFI